MKESYSLTTEEPVLNYETRTACIFLMHHYNQSLFQVCFFLSSFVIPLTLTFILYVLMLKRLWFSGPGGHRSAESVRSKRRVTRMVIVVVVIFAVCWCPIQIVLVLKSFDVYDINNTNNLIIQISSNILAYMNSCINPILYAFLSENFRKAFHKIIACNSSGRMRSSDGRREFERTGPESTVGTCNSKTTKLTNGNL